MDCLAHKLFIIAKTNNGQKPLVIPRTRYESERSELRGAPAASLDVDVAPVVGEHLQTE